MHFLIFFGVGVPLWIFALLKDPFFFLFIWANIIFILLTYRRARKIERGGWQNITHRCAYGDRIFVMATAVILAVAIGWKESLTQAILAIILLLFLVWESKRLKEGNRLVFPTKPIRDWLKWQK